MKEIIHEKGNMGSIVVEKTTNYNQQMKEGKMSLITKSTFWTKCSFFLNEIWYTYIQKSCKLKYHLSMDVVIVLMRKI